MRDDDRTCILRITAETFGPASIDRNIDERLGSVASSDWIHRKCLVVAAECDNHSNVLVAVDPEDRVLGYVTLRWDAATRVGGIPNLAVDHPHQGGGIGRALLEAAIESLRDRGADLVRIETLEQNPVGRHLYPSLGFVEVARQIHYALRLDTEPSGDPAPLP